MAQKITKEEVIKWYLIFKDQKNSGLSKTEYCKKHNLSYATFAQRRQWIIYRQENNPKLYSKQLIIAREYDKSNLSINHYIKDNNIVKTEFINMRRHLHYLKIIEEYESEQHKMNFIEVPKPVNPEALPIPITISGGTQPILEINKPPLEIKFSEQVKVTLPSNTQSEKLIKIIELLKDL